MATLNVFNEVPSVSNQKHFCVKILKFALKASVTFHKAENFEACNWWSLIDINEKSVP